MYLRILFLFKFVGIYLNTLRPWLSHTNQENKIVLKIQIMDDIVLGKYLLYQSILFVGLRGPHAFNHVGHGRPTVDKTFLSLSHKFNILVLSRSSQSMKEAL